jgi:hypothetical protein
MVPMRDGKRMQADIYRPKDESKKYPIIFSRTPYNFNYWDVELGAPRDMSARAGCSQARLRLHRDERARPLFLRRRLRHPRHAPDRLRRRTRLDGRAALVGGQGRAHRLLLDRGVAVGRGFARQQGARHHSFRRALARAWAASVPTTSRATGSAAARCRCSSAPGSTTTACRPTTASPTSLPACRSRRSSPRPSLTTSFAASARGRLGQGLLASAGERHPCGGRRQHGIFADTTPSGQPGMILRTPNDPFWYKGGLWNDSHAHQHSRPVDDDLVRRQRRPESGRVQLRAQDASPKSPMSSTPSSRPPALRLQARHGAHHRRRARPGRCAPRLRRGSPTLVRPLPQGRRQRRAREDAQGAVLHHGQNKWQRPTPGRPRTPSR